MDCGTICDERPVGRGLCDDFETLAQTPLPHVAASCGITYFCMLIMCQQTVSRVGNFGQHKVHVASASAHASGKDAQKTPTDTYRANALADEAGGAVRAIQHHSMKDKFTPKMERDAKFFFNRSLVRGRPGASHAAAQYPREFNSQNPELVVVLEAYYHHWNTWSREADDAAVFGSPSDRAASGMDQCMQARRLHTLPSLLPPQRLSLFSP